jgi:biotin synthase
MMTIDTTMVWHELADKALEGLCPSEAECLAVLSADDDQLLSVLDAAFRVRREYFGRKVKLNMLLNAKSGYCPEDCGYCSQSKLSSAPIDEYPMVDRSVILEGAKAAMERRAGTYCIVCSGRGPTPKQLDIIEDAVREIKATTPLKICACLGLLKDGDAQRLEAAGVDRYNHNINTSAGHHDSITKTHTYDDRVDTVEKVKDAGISPCSGVIVGMGETDEDIVQMAYALRRLDADSIPVNFLHAVAGTPLGDQKPLPPAKYLKILAMFRFVCPTKEIRASGGREVSLRSLQPLALYAANSIFVGDYLTTPGQAIEADHRMIEDMGFEIEEFCDDA